MNIIPSEQQSLKESKQLAQQLLSDAQALVQYCQLRLGRKSSELTSIDLLLRSFQEQLNKKYGRDVCDLVGPELYDWYYDALDLSKNEDPKLFYLHCLKLTNFLFIPFLTGHKSRLPGGKIFLSLDEQREVHFPQIDKVFKIDAKAGSSIQAEIVNDSILIGNGDKAKKISRKDLLMKMDGSSISSAPHIGSSPIFLKQSGRSLNKIIKKYERELIKACKMDTSLSAVPMKQFFDNPHEKIKIKKMDQALKLIEGIWPEMHREIIAVTHAITFIDGHAFVGGSNMAFHGVSFLNMESDWTIATYADHLVHEAAHLVLHTKYEMNPMLENATKSGLKSPIRRDPRPLYGIFHAPFFFLRLTQFFEKMLKQTNSKEAAIRLHRHLHGFYLGMKCIEENAEFTPIGREFFKEISREQKRFLKDLPTPDPRYYNKIGSDYERPDDLL